MHKNKRFTMRKIFIPMIALALFACGNKTDKNTAVNDSAKNVQTTEQEGEEELEGNLNYMGYDAMTFEVFGHVKTLKHEVYEQDIDAKGNIPAGTDARLIKRLAFDNEGNLDTKNIDWRLDNPKFTRNEDGQIIKVEWYMPDYDTNISDEFEYERGMIKKNTSTGIESATELVYTYDNETNLVSSVENASSEGTIFQINATYTILEKDNFNNWTRRLVKYEEKSGPDDGSGKFTDSFTYYNVEVRTITYWE